MAATAPNQEEVLKGYDSPTGHDGAQLDFFDAFQLEQKPRWTRAATLYDALPKFVFGNDSKARLATYTAREDRVNIDGITLHVMRTPGSVVRRDAEGKLLAHGRWPGEREELVMRALRYLAVQQHVPMSYWQHADPAKTPQIRVRFTLNQLRTLLTDWGHSYNSKQIDEALSLLTDAKLTVRGEGAKDESIYSGALISGYFGLNRKEGGGAQMRAVILNPLEAQAIISGAYRALKIDRLMSIDDPIARRLFEILVTRHTGADKPSANTRPFIIRLSQLIEEGVIDRAQELKKTAARVRGALHALGQKGLLWPQRPYVEKRETERTKGRAKIVDVVWELWPSAPVVADIIAANAEIFTARSGETLYGKDPTRTARARKMAQNRLEDT